MAELSLENKRSLVQGAIKELYPGDMSPWVEDMTDSKAYYNYDGKTYQAPYSINEEGGVKLGTPTEVMRKIVYQGITHSTKGRRIV